MQRALPKTGRGRPAKVSEGQGRGVLPESRTCAWGRRDLPPTPLLQHLAERWKRHSHPPLCPHFASPPSAAARYPPSPPWEQLAS